MKVRHALSFAAVPLLLMLVAIGVVMGTDSTRAAPLAGAIFTTTPDGTIVNENVHYEDKRDVYLDGGPGPNAPQTAAGLPDGDYVFQVTDPSGKVLLSEDKSKCRVFRVDDGVIVTLRRKANGGFVDQSASANDACHVADNPPHPTNPGVRGNTGKHDTNVDADHGPPAIVVQLMPYFNTPNPGGVYKAWITPLSTYTAKGGDVEKTPQRLCLKNGRLGSNCNGNGVQIGFYQDPGFGPSRDQVKTDNFKVQDFRPPEIKIRKFHDVNGDGIWQSTEPEIGRNGHSNPSICVLSDGTIDADCTAGGGGWPISITEPLEPPVTEDRHTPHIAVAGVPGTYTICEGSLPGWNQTALYRDGTQLKLDEGCVTVQVQGTSGERHEVIFGNDQKFEPTPTPTTDDCIDHTTGKRLRWCGQEDVIK